MPTYVHDIVLLYSMGLGIGQSDPTYRPISMVAALVDYDFLAPLWASGATCFKS